MTFVIDKDTYVLRRCKTDIFYATSMTTLHRGEFFNKDIQNIRFLFNLERNIVFMYKHIVAL